VNSQLFQVGLQLLQKAVNRWLQHCSLTEESAGLIHQLNAAVRLSDDSERRRQVSPLLNPLQLLAHRLEVQAGSEEDRKAAHLALASAYMALGEWESHKQEMLHAGECVTRQWMKASNDGDDAEKARYDRDLAELGDLMERLDKEQPSSPGAPKGAGDGPHAP
jgi:hypothetical protein